MAGLFCAVSVVSSISDGAALWAASLNIKLEIQVYYEGFKGSIQKIQNMLQNIIANLSKPRRLYVLHHNQNEWPHDSRRVATRLLAKAIITNIDLGGLYFVDAFHVHSSYLAATKQSRRFKLC